MGYFDGLTAAAFKQDARGRDLFFLWGKFGKGRVVPTEADGVSVRQYLKNYYLCVILGIVPVVVISGEALQPRWFGTIGVFALLALAAFIPLWLRTRQWQLSDERMTYRESISASAQAHGAGSLWLLIVLSGLFVAGGLFLVLKSDAVLIGALCVLFFGACLGVFVWMLIARQRG
jgi:heme/copper-type cytochrome/quinol oxidase subunit 4